MSAAAPVRHAIPDPRGGQPLELTNNEAFALVEVSKAVRGLGEAALFRLAGNAHPEERAELLSAFAQLHAFLTANGWSIP